MKLKLICAVMTAVVGVAFTSAKTTDSQETKVIASVAKHVKLPDYTLKIKQDSIETKERLISEVNRYIADKCPKSPMTAENIVELCLLYDFDIPLLLAQGTLETHMGTPGKNSRNSVFGLKNGKRYKHPDHAVEDYILLMKNRYISKRSVEDALRRGLNVEGSRKMYYCSGHSYSSRIIKMRNDIMKNYKLKVGN